MSNATSNTAPTTPESPTATYNHEWNLTVRADSLAGAMDAVWKCWQAWHSGTEPLSGCCPATMGERMDYRVEKVKSPQICGVNG